MKKLMRVTTVWYGGSGVKSVTTEVREVSSGHGHSRPLFAMAGTRHCGGLPIERRTNKFYAKLEWQVCHGGSHV